MLVNVGHFQIHLKFASLKISHSIISNTFCSISRSILTEIMLHFVFEIHLCSFLKLLCSISSHYQMVFHVYLISGYRNAAWKTDLWIKKNIFLKLAVIIYLEK